MLSEDACVRYREKKKTTIGKNSGIPCFATSVYSKKTDNLRLQAMIELEKRHEKERENLC